MFFFKQLLFSIFLTILLSVLHETERCKLENELEAELKVSVVCDQDDGINVDGELD